MERIKKRNSLHHLPEEIIEDVSVHHLQEEEIIEDIVLDHSLPEEEITEDIVVHHHLPKEEIIEDIVVHHQIPEEIIEDIVVKLPVKSINRCLSVSKSLSNLIKSSRFIHRHLIESEESFVAMCFVVHDSVHMDRLFISLCRYDDYLKKQAANYTWQVLNFELPCSYNCCTLYLVGQFNGVMCLTYDNVILLINPSLGEVKSIPSMLTFREYGRLVGFGFDNMTKDFKVVRVNLTAGTQQRADVYDLRSNGWRNLDDIIPVVILYSTNCSTFFNGVVHWCVGTRLSDWRILTFNLATELFQQIEFPQDWCTNDNHCGPALFVLNQESLAFVSYQECYSLSQFVKVWTMNKHGIEETWTKLYSIGPLYHFSKPISFYGKYKLLYRTSTGKVILYDIFNNHSFIICEDGSLIPPYDSHCFPLCLETGVYKASLVSINQHVRKPNQFLQSIKINAHRHS